MSLVVVRPGPLATVQDAGRFGHSAVGVGHAGAADRAAWRLANRLVGNDESAAAVEITMGGFAVRATRPVTVALSGAACPVLVDGRPSRHVEAIRLDAGTLLELGVPERGLRSYLAVRGGIEVTPVLGSRSTDTMAGIGPAPLVAGASLPIGQALHQIPAADVVPLSLPGELTLRVLLGPRDDWFTLAAIDALLGQPWTVSADADRVGIRLQGAPLGRRRRDELPSEGCVRGALQVSGDGMPTMLLSDHPVTGGYPVISVVTDVDTDHAAQARPGTTIRFRRR